MASFVNGPRASNAVSVTRHARAQGTLSNRAVRREKDYLRCEGVLRPACGKGWAGRPLRGLPENDPLAATSRPARHDTRRRKGEAKHDTAKDSGGRIMFR